MEWLNSLTIRKKEEGHLLEALFPYIEKAGLQVDQIDRHYLTQIAAVLKENLVVLSQVEEYLGIFFDEKFAFEDGAKTVLSDSNNRETLQTILAVLEAFPDTTSNAWPSLLTQLEERTGKKRKNLLAPFRAAITGKTRGPELARTLSLVGGERMIKRLKMALALS